MANRYCPICGNPVPPGHTYDRAACKQKAYRNRKKQKKAAEEKTIDLDAWVIQDKAIKCFGDGMNYALGEFFQKHGKESYTDLLLILDRVL